MISFIKLASDFKVDWDIDDITSKMSDDIQIPNNLRSSYTDSSGIVHDRPYTDSSGIAHWQYYTAGISFSRNFFKNFPHECIDVVIKLKKLQWVHCSSSTDNELLLTFINHNIVPNRVNIIRTIGGTNVNVHCDTTRNSCINIGLKNSNTFKTRISESQDVNNFHNNPTETYTMNDGDAYLINIKNAHSVESLINNVEPRYLITYNLNEI